jgi:hypothetical protein
VTNTIRPMATTFLAVFTVLSIASCSTGNDPSLSIGVSLSPAKANITAGMGVSCVAQAAAKEADTIPTGDIPGDRVLFRTFALQWRSGDKLTIAEISATIYSAGIEGADTPEGQKIPLSEAEAAALLGLTNLSIDYVSPYAKDGRNFTIDSTDATSKGATSLYAPCGFQIGGFKSKAGVNTYSARIKVEVIGFKTACDLQENGTCLDGEQSPVRQSVTVSAQRF